VKKVAVFWEFFNIRKQTTIMVVKTDDGPTNVDVDAGYYTFNDMKEKLERSGVTLTYHHQNARIWIETTKHKVTIKRKLLEMLGLRRFGDQLVLPKGASAGGEINHWGKPSDVITSVTVADYIDVESRNSIVKGTCSELIFHVTDQDGKSIDIGEVLIEMYLE
jgi:hypothetical protein